MAIGCSEPVAEIVSTSNSQTYDFGSFTPGTSRILVVLALVRTSVAAGSMSTVSGTSLTWTRKTSGTFNSGADTMYCFWARTPASTAASVYRINVTGDAGAGCIAYMFEFTGGDMTSADPVKQAKTASGSSTNPTITLDAAMNTANGYCAAWMGALSSSNPANVSTEPTSWTEVGDNGFGSPTSNGSGAYRAGGETGSTITFTAATTVWGLIAAEVKVVAQDLAPTVVGTAAEVVNPTMSPGAATLTPTISGTTAGVVNPTLTPGAVTITPDAASVTAEGVAPTISIAIPPQTLEPTVVGVSAGTVDPTLVAGAATLTPTVVGTTAGTVDPTLVAGAATLTPTVVGVASGTVDPTLTPGAATLAPDVAATASDGVAPTLTPGAVSVEPTTASVDSGTGTVGLSSLGSLELTPDTAGAAAGTVDPTLSPGAATLTPDVADGASGTVSPTLGAGAVSLAPDVAGADAGTVGPTLTPGAVTIEPTAASADSGTGTVGLSSLSALELSPDPAEAAGGTVGPTLTAGATILTPDVAEGAAGTISPTFGAGAVSLEPDTVGASSGIVNPTLSHGAWSFTPDMMVLPYAIGTSAQWADVYPPPAPEESDPHWLIMAGRTSATGLRAYTAGLRELYNVDPLPYWATGISSVSARFYAKQIGGGVNQMRLIWKLGSTEVASADITMESTIKTYLVTGMVRPGGGSWNVNDFNSLQFGIESTLVQAGQSIIIYPRLELHPEVTSAYGVLWTVVSGILERKTLANGTIDRVDSSSGSLDRVAKKSGSLDRADVADGSLERIPLVSGKVGRI